MKEEAPHIDLMIAGFQKCGTTSLKAYLAQHPSIVTHPQVECSYFFDDEQFQQGPSFLRKKYFPARRSAAEQKSLAKHAVLFRKEEALRRFERESPEGQLLLLLRDPVERAFSSYLHQRKMDQERYSFGEVLERTLSEDPRELEAEWRWRYNVYIAFGCYADYLRRILKRFPEERVHLFLMEELERDPLRVSQRIFERMGVDPAFRPDTSKAENQASVPRSRSMARMIRRYVHRENRMKRLLRSVFPSGVLAKSARWVKEANQKPVKQEEMKPGERERLRTFYAPWNEELERISELELSAWRKRNADPHGTEGT